MMSLGASEPDAPLTAESALYGLVEVPLPLAPELFTYQTLFVTVIETAPVSVSAALVVLRIV